MSRTRAEMIEETRVKLLAAARKAFRDSGYAAASMDELTAAAGLTCGALYHHFGDKQGLLAAVAAELDQKWTRGCSASGRGARRLDGAARTLPRLAAHGDRTRNPAHRATGRRAPCWGRPRSRPSSPASRRWPPCCKA